MQCRLLGPGFDGALLSQGCWRNTTPGEAARCPLRVYGIFVAWCAELPWAQTKVIYKLLSKLGCKHKRLCVASAWTLASVRMLAGGDLGCVGTGMVCVEDATAFTFNT